MNQKYFNKFYDQYIKILFRLHSGGWVYRETYLNKIDAWKHLSKDWKSVKDEIFYESQFSSSWFNFYSSLFQWSWWAILSKMLWHDKNRYVHYRTQLENNLLQYFFFDNFYGIIYLYHNNKKDFDYFIENFWIVFIFYKYLLDSMKEFFDENPKKIKSIKSYNQFLIEYEKSKEDFKIIEKSIWKEFVDFSIQLFERIKYFNAKKLLSNNNIFYKYCYEFIRGDDFIRLNWFTCDKESICGLTNTRQSFDYTLEDLRKIHEYLENNKSEYTFQKTMYIESLLNWFWKKDNLKDYIYNIFIVSIFDKTSFPIENFNEAKNLQLWIVKKIFEYTNESYTNVVLSNKKNSLKYNILTQSLRYTYSNVSEFFRNFVIDDDMYLAKGNTIHYDENFEIDQKEILNLFLDDYEYTIKSDYDFEVLQKKLFDNIYFRIALYRRYNIFQETINSELYYIWLFDFIIHNKNSEFSKKLLDFIFSYYDFLRDDMYNNIVSYNIFINYYEKYKDRYDADKFKEIKFYFLEHLKNLKLLCEKLDILWEIYK